MLTDSQAILNGIDLGIVTADAAGDVTFLNRTARALLEVTEEYSGPVTDLLLLHAHPDVLLGDEPNRVIAYSVPTLAGGELELQLSISRAASTFFFIFRDTREEKMRSIERERFGRLVAVGTMVAGFAHEVRNPVAALRSLAESLAEELADAKIALPHVTRMLSVLDRIERLVRTSLQFGRPASPQREWCRPAVIVTTAITQVNTHITVDIEQDIPELYVDDSQIVQALVILLTNALDSVGGAPSRVFVRVRTGTSRAAAAAAAVDTNGGGERAIRFEVHDDGAGIPHDILGQIFDPFFTTKPAGTGLGLSIAQQIVSENGGVIEVASQRAGGKGGDASNNSNRSFTSFSIVLPPPTAALVAAAAAIEASGAEGECRSS